MNKWEIIMKDLLIAMMKAAGRFVDESNLPQLNLALAEKACKSYQRRHGYVPSVWVRISAKLKAQAKYTEVLRRQGFSGEELEEMSLVELRDEVNKNEFILSTVALPSGGVSRVKRPLKKIA